MEFNRRLYIVCHMHLKPKLHFLISIRLLICFTMQTYYFYSTQHMENTTFAIEEDNINSTSENYSQENSRSLSIRFIQSGIASVGIVANLTVIVVFLNHKKLRKKIPNIFIINQVSRRFTSDETLSLSTINFFLSDLATRCEIKAS